MTQGLGRKQTVLIMLGAMLTLLLAALDNTIVGTAMPKILRDLHGVEHYAWPFTAYMLFSTLILPISGKLADIYGRKRVTICGIVIFAAASMLCGLSRSMIELSVLRGLQGIGGGICISSAFIIVSEVFPPKKRGKYIGFVTSMFAVASILGPGAGGIITDLLSWRWVFFINLPLSAAALFLIAKYFPHIVHHEEKRKIDAVGVTAFLLCAFPFLFAVSQAGTRPLLSPLMAGLFVFSAIMFAVFLRIERKSKEPLLSLHFFNERVFTASVVASSLANMAVFGAAIYFPLYLQSVRGVSAARSGAIMMPMMVSMIIASNITGIVMSRTTAFKRLAFSGLFLAFIGMLLFGLFGGKSPLGGLIVYSTLAGIGMGMTFPVFTVSAQCIFPPRQIGVITSLLQFFRNLGGSIGSAVFGAVMIAVMKKEMAGIQAGQVPSSAAELVKNPGILSNPQKLAALRDSVPADALPDFERLVSSALHSVSGSIEMIFIVAGGILFIGLFAVIVLFDQKRVAHAIGERRMQHQETTRAEPQTEAAAEG